MRNSEQIAKSQSLEWNYWIFQYHRQTVQYIKAESVAFEMSIVARLFLQSIIINIIYQINWQCITLTLTRQGYSKLGIHISNALSRAEAVKRCNLIGGIAKSSCSFSWNQMQKQMPACFDSRTSRRVTGWWRSPPSWTTCPGLKLTKLCCVQVMNDSDSDSELRTQAATLTLPLWTIVSLTSQSGQL